MLRILFLSVILISTGVFADTTAQKLYKSVNSGVVELHVKSIADPKPGQVSYKANASQESLGSGALVSEKGRILTAAHVVDRATDIKVIFDDGTETTGHVVWVNTMIDLAMIQAAELPDKVTTLPLAKSGDYQVGEQVYVIGAPFGVSHSLSVGYLSGIRDREKIPGTNLVPRFLQTDAAINTGNSGGPMFNSQGEIIGIVSFILSRTGENNGLGFVVSIDTVHDIINSDPGTFSGFIPHLLTPQQAKALNNPFGYGMLIQQVIPGTMADRLGFKGGYLNVMVGRTPVLLGGDIILDIASRPLKDLASVMKIKQRLTEYEKGDKIEVRFLREGVEKKVRWTIE